MLFEFYSNYFSPKIQYMENRVTRFPTVENWREINLKLFWYFKNDFYWILLGQNHSLLYLNLCVFYLTLEKCSSRRKSFSENFDI